MARRLILSLVAACGSNTPPAEPHPTLEAAPPDARHNDASDDVNAVAKQLAPITAKQSKPNIAAELRGTPLAIRDVQGLMLFDDEQAVAAAAIAAWARASNLVVVEPSHSRELVTHARHGETPTGASCGTSLSEDRAAQRWKSELGAKGRIEASVQCTPECSLIVTVASPSAAAYFAAPYDVTRPWRSELVHSLSVLVDALDAKRSAAGSTEPGSPADLAADAPPAAPLFGIELRDRVAHCIPAGEAVSVLVDLDAQGKVTRCEGEDHHARGNYAVAACACGDLATATFSDAKGRRRGVATFTNKQGPVTTKRGARVHATFTSSEAELAGRFVPIELCFATESDPQPFEADVALDIDAAGVVSKVTLAKKDGCITAALKAIKLPCPTAAFTAHGKLAVTFDKP